MVFATVERMTLSRPPTWVPAIPLGRCVWARRPFPCQYDRRRIVLRQASRRNRRGDASFRHRIRLHPLRVQAVLGVGNYFSHQAYTGDYFVSELRCAAAPTGDFLCFIAPSVRPRVSTAALAPISINGQSLPLSACRMGADRSASTRRAFAEPSKSSQTPQRKLPDREDW
jgi:hypothetical protein